MIRKVYPFFVKIHVSIYIVQILQNRVTGSAVGFGETLGTGVGDAFVPKVSYGSTLFYGLLTLFLVC